MGIIGSNGASHGANNGGYLVGRSTLRLATLCLLGLMVCGAASAQVQTFFYSGMDGRYRERVNESRSFTAVLLNEGGTVAQLQQAVAANAEAVDEQVVLHLPRTGVVVLPITGTFTEAQADVRELVRAGFIKSGLRVYDPAVGSIAARAGDPRAFIAETDEICVRPRPGVDAGALWDRYGVTVLRQFGGRWAARYGCTIVRVLHPEDQSPTDIANAIVDSGQVDFAHPNLFTPPHFDQAPRTPRAPFASSGRAPLPRFLYTPNDPLYPNQWHLNNTGQGGGTAGADVSAEQAWDLTRGDSEVVVAINDSGVDTKHEDLAGGGKIVAPYNVGDDSNNADPTPGSGAREAHGTAVAGVAVANGNNGIGVTGVAPDSRLMPIKLAPQSLEDYAESFLWALDNPTGISAAVHNNSWKFVSFTDTPTVVSDAIVACATQGRNGLGMCILAAAANDNSGYGVDNGLADTTTPANHPMIWSVAASDDRDLQSSYSNTGDDVDFAAPSNGGASGITTTDITGNDGYTNSNYDNDFGGTSSASPLAAGIVALVLSRDPRLTRDEVYQVLTSTAVKIDPGTGNYGSNGHSRFYGYGRLNAFAALDSIVVIPRVMVNVSASTSNANQPGAVKLDKNNHIVVQYTLNGETRTARVWDGMSLDIETDQNTQIIFPGLSTASGSQQRWINQNPPTFDIGTEPMNVSAEYFHQYARPFKTAVQSATGAVGLGQGNTVEVTTTSFGETTSFNLGAGPVNRWLDPGSSYTLVDTVASGSNNDERWVAADTTGDFVPDPVTKQITTAPPAEIVFNFFHQTQPRILLSGTTTSNTASVVRRRYFGKVGENTQIAGVSGIFSDWVDVGSTLGFSESTTPEPGQPVLRVDGRREFDVLPGLEGTVRYLVQPLASGSGLEAARPNAPANGRTAINVSLIVRDSAGNPVSGIAASRLDLFAEQNAGVTITKPEGATNSSGRLTFQVTGTEPSEVTLYATLDGRRIGSEGPDDPGLTTTVEFLRIIPVPLPAPGVYLLSFPVTPDNSEQVIRDFNVQPMPPQVATWTGNGYTFFRLDRQTPDFRIFPGKGFFVRTTAPGSIELTGELSGDGPYTIGLPYAGFNLVGNPMADRPMIWRMADFIVLKNGEEVGRLDDPATWRYVSPVAWTFDGVEYEMVADPVLPGTDGARSSIDVFEGFFWQAFEEGVGVVYEPNSGLSRGSLNAPRSPGHFGVTLNARVGERDSRVIVGALRQGFRMAAPPVAPESERAVELTLVTPDGGRAMADWLGTPIVRPTTWQMRVAAAPGEEVTLSWDSLNRQLPAGYRVRLHDLTTDTTTLLNTRGAYRFTAPPAGRAIERVFEVTVLPSSGRSLQVLSFTPAPGRSGGRSVAFDVELSSDAQVVLQVSSLSGRTLTETRPQSVAGRASLLWDGRDAAGRPAPRGVYRVTLIAHNDEGEVVRQVRVITLR